MTYLLIKNGLLIKAIGAVDGRQANRVAAQEGGIAVLVVGKQDPDAIFDHIVKPLRDEQVPTQEEADEFITQEEIERIINKGGVEVSAEKVDDNDKD